jgi:hypothetical protein
VDHMKNRNIHVPGKMDIPHPLFDSECGLYPTKKKQYLHVCIFLLQIFGYALSNIHFQEGDAAYFQNYHKKVK